MIEDAPETALQCAESGIHVILFDMPWNQALTHKNITRIHSWKEALKVIDEMKQ